MTANPWSLSEVETVLAVVRQELAQERAAGAVVLRRIAAELALELEHARTRLPAAT